MVESPQHRTSCLVRAKWPVLLQSLVSSRRTGYARSGVDLLLSIFDIFGLNFSAPPADFVVVALATLRPFRCDGLKSLKTRIENGIFFAAQIRACAAVNVDVAFAPLRPFKRFLLFFVVHFRVNFVPFSLFLLVGASHLRARCGLRAYRLRPSRTIPLLLKISFNSIAVERPPLSGAPIGTGRDKY